jgi:hypothetical protein
LASAVEIFAPPVKQQGVLVNEDGEGLFVEVGHYEVRFQVDSVEENDGIFTILGTVSGYSATVYFYVPGAPVPRLTLSTDRVAIFADSNTGEIRAFMDVTTVGNEIFAGLSFNAIGIVR